MVGSAGATMVCSSALRNIASMMPAVIARTVAWSTGAAVRCASPEGASAALQLLELMNSL